MNADIPMQGPCTAAAHDSAHPARPDPCDRTSDCSLDAAARQTHILSANGLIQLYLGNYPAALAHNLAALRISQTTGDSQQTAALLKNTGLLYMEMDDLETALFYLKKSLAMPYTPDNLISTGDILDNMSTAYLRRGDHRQALHYGRESRAIYQKAGSKQGEAEALLSLGEIYTGMGNSDEALICLQQSLAIAHANSFQLTEIAALLAIGQIHARQSVTDKALDYLGRALALARAIPCVPQIAACHKALADTYKQVGAFEQALAHYEQFHDAHLQSFTEEADVRLRHLQVMHEIEATRTETEITRLRNVELSREIAERKRAEADLKCLNQRLRDEIAQREKLIADLDSFAHSVAHDLKNPLALIAGYTDLLIADLRPVVDAQTFGMLDQVYRIADKSIHIVDEMLILAGVRHQQVDLIPVSTGDIIHEVECRLKFMIEEYRAEIVRPLIWPLALGQPIWIEEIWSNYISNAIKYGGTPPRVELGAAPLDDGTVRFWVKDNGDGVNPEAQAQLFTDFSRLETTRATGHGLGLSIVRRIVEKMGGQVAMESSNVPGEGCTFSFTLPQVTSLGKG